MRTGIAKNLSSVLMVAGLLLPGSARSAIVLHDGSVTTITQNSNSSSITNTFTVTAGADVLVVSTYIRNDAGSDYPPTLSDWSGQSFMQIAGAFNARSTYAQCDIFYIVNPTPGTQSIVVTDTTGMPVSAMAMQVYTLSGVDTTAWPLFYGANKAFGTSDSVFLSNPSPPNGGWAAFSICWGYNGAGTTVTSTSGTPGYAQVQAGDAVLMGGVANLGVGDTTITASNPGGGGVQSALAVAVFAPYIVPGTPTAPYNLVATGETNQIALSWDDSSGGAATSYIVLRSTTSGSGFTLIATVTTNGYTDATVANFTTYYFEISSVNSIGTSANSAQVSATPGPLLTNYFGVFNSSADVANWKLIQGSYGGTAFFTNDAPAGGPSIGCLVFRVSYANSMSGGTGNHALPHYNETNATALEFDVKNLGPWYQGYGIQQLQPVLMSDANGSMQWSGPGIPQSSTDTNNGWVHVVMPITSNDAGNPANWRGIWGINLNLINNPWYPNVTNMLIGYANFKFTGAPGFRPVFSGLTSHTIPSGTASVFLAGKVSGGNGNYLFKGTPITVTINGVAQTTTISDTVGDFNISYNTSGLAAGAYSVTYVSASDNQIFVAGTNSATSLTVNPAAPTAPTILPVYPDGTGMNLVLRVATQNGYTYYLLSTTNLATPVVWATNTITAGTGGTVTNLVPILKSNKGLFLKYRVQ